ncbi:MAG: hypothetical protein ACI9J2_002422 [Saprospiraceae bacterium]
MASLSKKSFPRLQQEVGELTSKQQKLIEVIELAQFELFLPEISGYVGRPSNSRLPMARAFVAKAIYNMPTTEMLLDRLDSDIKLRRICGWEKIREVPSRSTFSRAFNEFSVARLTERVDAGIIDSQLSAQLIGHIALCSLNIEDIEACTNGESTMLTATKALQSALRC